MSTKYIDHKVTAAVTPAQQPARHAWRDTLRGGAMGMPIGALIVLTILWMMR